MATGTIIEAALNGPWGRGGQPQMPILTSELIEEGIACANAGASILHLHAYDELSGVQDDRSDRYARVIEGILDAAPQVMIYPTIPLMGSTLTGSAPGPRERFNHVESLQQQGLIEMTVVDPGSVNFTRYDRAAGASGFVYTNPEDHIRYGLQLCLERSLRPSFAIYEPGFTRLGATLARDLPGLRSPIYRFMFSDEFAWGFPPKNYGLQAHLQLLEEFAPRSIWMIGGLGVDIRPLIARSVSLGGHVRVGLEDAPFGCEQSNVELVEEAVRLIREVGSEPATPAEARAHLANVDVI